MSDLATLKRRQEVARSAAVRTLEALGYTYHGAEMWKPPIGKAPDFDLIDSLRAEVERLRTRLEIDERTPYDGIACRDETIKGLDEKCDRLKAENEALRKLLDSGRYYIPENKIELLGLIDAALEGGGK